jgi:hypothetical protein
MYLTTADNAMLKRQNYQIHKRELQGDDTTSEQSDADRQERKKRRSVFSEMGQPIRPLDRLVERRRSRSKTEKDFKDVVYARRKVEKGDEHADDVD